MALAAGAIGGVANSAAPERSTTPTVLTGPAGDMAIGRLGTTATVAPPPTLSPTALAPVAPADAVAANAAVPFAATRFPAAAPFRMGGSPVDQARAVDCLATAVLYEAGDDKVGQRAVAQVVLNRARHPAFPASVCGVVFQGSERQTGCQFTFTCDGALSRDWPTPAWARARDVAIAALAGAVDASVGLSTHYHTDWVRPYWSDSLEKLARVGTHLFFRWPGGWGRPGAFRTGLSSSGEPAVAKLAGRFPAHADALAQADAAAAIPDMPTATSAPAERRLDARGFVVADRVAMIGTVAPSSAARALDTRRAAAEPEATAGEREARGPRKEDITALLDPAGSAEGFYALALRECGDAAYCKFTGWTDKAMRPASGAPTDAQRKAMAFSYLRDTNAGLERALWDCSRYPRADRRQCMRR